MRKIKNLPLEEKLQIPLLELPLSREVKKDLQSKGVHSFTKLYVKFLKLMDHSTGEICAYLPGFRCKTYEESELLLRAMRLLPAEGISYKEYESINPKIGKYVNQRV